MSNTTIVNGAPMVRSLGTQDISRRALLVQPEQIPTHCPKVWLYAAKGKAGPQLVVGDGRTQMYGDDTFDLRKQFATHQTVLSNLVNAEGNAQMIERVFPDDMGPPANFILWLDVLATDIVQYRRDAQGRFIKDDITGDPIPVSPAQVKAGYKVKWVVTSIAANPSNLTPQALYGNLASTAGDQTDGISQSTRYPILAFWGDERGSYYNNTGIRLWAPTIGNDGNINESILKYNGFPLRLAVVRRDSASTTARVVASESGGQDIEFTLRPAQINPDTDSLVSLGDQYPAKYQEVGSTIYQDKFADLSGFKIYQDNINTLIAQFYTAEKGNTTLTTDWTAGAVDSAEQWKFNLFTGTSSQDSPYFTYWVDYTAANSVRLSENTNFFAMNGTDGTMDETRFAALVSSAVSGYADENSQLMDSAYNVESIVYDTGFPLATKYDLAKVLTHRKDIACILSTHIVGAETLSADEDHSVAVALRTRLQMYPDSDYFGTAVFRGLVMGRSGVLRDSQYKKRLPLTMELAVKSAKMMGAGNGIWKTEALFDMADNNVITLFDQVSVPFTPAKQRNKDWDVGLNYASRFDRKRLYFPALKTAYNDDTSVLTGFFTMMACVELQKVGERVHKRFSGVQSLTSAQLCDRVNKKVEEFTVGRFANMFQIVPAAFITDADEQRGFSWTLPIKLYANNMKTVQSLYIQAARMSDFPGSNG